LHENHGSGIASDVGAGYFVVTGFVTPVAYGRVGCAGRGYGVEGDGAVHYLK